jgi:hypothetical protein
MSHHPFFYDKAIIQDAEQKYINNILKKYKKEAANEELKRKIWDDLQREKALGKISIPFKVVLRKDPTGKFPPFVEVILDTKV